MEAAADGLEASVLAWAHPGFRWYDAPTDGWALTRLYDALLLLGGYAVVAGLLIVYNLNKFALERARRERRIGSTEGGGYRLGGAVAPVKIAAAATGAPPGAKVSVCLL